MAQENLFQVMLSFLHFHILDAAAKYRQNKACLYNLGAPFTNTVWL